MVRTLLDEQIAYYAARADEYDEWFFRRGSYDRGPEFLRAWNAEIEIVEAALRELRPFGSVLELACGTGLWTRRLAEGATSVLAVDASAEVLAHARRRVPSGAVRFVQENLFAWRPDQRYELVFFSFWLSHVPPPRFEEFWSLVQACLAPGGRVFFVDNRLNATSFQHQHILADGEDYVVERKLNDGTPYRIVKVFHEPHALAAKLADLGWQADVRASGEFFVFGRGVRADA